MTSANQFNYISQRTIGSKENIMTMDTNPDTHKKICKILCALEVQIKLDRAVCD